MLQLRFKRVVILERHIPKFIGVVKQCLGKVGKRVGARMITNPSRIRLTAPLLSLDIFYVF